MKKTKTKTRTLKQLRRDAQRLAEECRNAENTYEFNLPDVGPVRVALSDAEVKVIEKQSNEMSCTLMAVLFSTRETTFD